MTSVAKYSARSMSVGFAWPSEVTGLERVVLSAQGDLQRNLSAFFARPITVSLLSSRAYTQGRSDDKLVPLSMPISTAVASASPTTPVIQQRKVNLMCAGKVVCTATSTVRIASPECATLVLEEKYAIGQVFLRLAKSPAFELVTVGMGPSREVGLDAKMSADHGHHEGKQLWRKYRLTIPEFECDILEVFPSREMFTRCEEWLLDSSVHNRTFSKLRLGLNPKVKWILYSLYALVLLTVGVWEFWKIYTKLQDTDT
ncbi:hypothetical protein M378DRAFT_162118 [Amanita muscaria Koide BX008]|uniref:Transmembrane protein n=1 Tax=Amanita muscaria (strain Koide BX008) TaxID=946122 RepID=A0A0C2X9R1_AMAMK|nr:hypothetical protein M378DRAFT_162118 [Amanita muscaria Koide BX008]